MAAQPVKRIIYIIAFIVFGILLQQIIHAGFEILAIELLVKDFAAYGFGLSWNSWIIIHNLMTVILLLAGIAFGWWAGVACWQILYVEKRGLKHRRFRRWK